MDEPIAIDGSDGPLVVRRVVVWRRLEPGDVRTPGTEIAPESPHLEAKVVQVGVSEELRDDLVRLWEVRDAVTSITHSWTARYEPAGLLFALGGGLAVGTWLDYLPESLLLYALSLMALGVGVGAFTRVQKSKREREADRRWRDTPERRELEQIEKTLTPRWKRFAERLKEEEGFRTDVRVGDVHEADRLVSLDLSRITHPGTWKPEDAENEVRYGWAYRDGRVVEQVAELEDTEREPPLDSDSREHEHDDGSAEEEEVEAGARAEGERKRAE